MSAAALRLWLEGPMQSWGTSSRFEVRTTDLAPSKSGVVGLLAAALGRPRDEPVDDLAAMRFGVRIERAGRVVRDYQTVGSGSAAAGIAVASGARSGRRGIQTERYYLEDAAFVAAFESEDRALLERCRDAVLEPRWPLALGRRSCPPGAPLVHPHAIIEGDLEVALGASWSLGPFGTIEPLSVDHPAADAERRVRALVEDPLGDIESQDQPVGAAFATRQFALRRARSLLMGPAA